MSWIRGLVTCSVPIRCLWTQSQNASHETLFDAYGLNLRMHPHEFLSPANESQDCIPMSSYSMPMNLRMHSHEFLFDAKFLESFDWVPPMSYHPDSGMPIESTQLRPECDFVCTPTHTTWIPPKSIVERFRCLLRDFRFSLGFMRTSDSSMHDFQYLCGFYKNPTMQAG